MIVNLTTSQFDHPFRLVHPGDVKVEFDEFAVIPTRSTAMLSTH